METIDRSEIESECKARLGELLKRIKVFASKYDNYLKAQSYQSTVLQFWKPASRSVHHRLELLEWLLTSICYMEVELELNNRLMEKYSRLEEEAEDTCLIMRQFLQMKCLDAEVYEQLKASKQEFDQNYSTIWANREKSDHYFLELLPEMDGRLKRLTPIQPTPSSASEFEELILSYLASISTFEEETKLKSEFDEFFQKIYDFNNFLNAQYKSDLKSIESYLKQGNSIFCNHFSV